MRVPAAATGSWRDDVCNHRYAIALWFLLNLLDYGLTVVGMSWGAHELNPLAANLSPPMLALYKSVLTVTAVAWLAVWKWMRFLKWLNILFILVVSSNIYDLIVRPIY